MCFSTKTLELAPTCSVGNGEELWPLILYLHSVSLVTSGGVSCLFYHSFFGCFLKGYIRGRSALLWFSQV